MALIQTMPEDIPTTNALHYIADPDEQPTGERAEIYLSGAHVATLENAPAGRERITMMVELEVVEESIRFTENGETEVPIRRCRRIGDMWRPGSERPPTKEEIQAEQAREKARAAAERAEHEEAERAEKEHNEPPMFDEDGDPIAIDGPGEDTEGQGDDGDNVVQFSDKSKA